LDTPPGKLPGEAPSDNRALPVGKAGALMQPVQPIKTTRTFTPGSSASADLLQDPLWYAAKWGGFKDLNKDGKPDKVEWDADNDNNPDNYFLVTNALTLKAQLSNAFAEIIARSGSASSAAVNAGSITEDSKLFQALFSTADWSGSVIAYKINEDGSLDASAWAGDAARLLPSPTARKIFTTTSAGAKIPFTWDKLDTTRQSQLQPSDTKGEDRLNWLRGDRTKEIRYSGGYLRNRNPDTVLGDIVNGAPLYVGAPPFRYGNLETANYTTFKAAKKERTKMLYVGANDGMLHAFRADDGIEAWAFIPSPVFKNLHELTSPGYQHRFYVDGAPVMGDAYYDSTWHTMLVAGLNNGGQGIYTLDITDPSSGTDEQTIANARYKWEFTDANDKDLGYTYSRPAIVRVKSGKWVAIFGNGYNNTVNDGTLTTSTTGNAVLYVVDIKTGALLRKLDTGVGMSADPLATNRPNGLASVAVSDLEGDFAADYVYAGDLFGNLWKFDITDSTPANWKVAYKDGSNNPLPLFVAKDSSGKRQPITSKPAVMLGKRGVGLQILFGTGKYLELADRDVNLLTTQSFYSVIDNLAGTSTDIIATRASLTQQTIVAETTVNNRLVRATSATVPDASSRGWYLDLVSPGPTFKGEMVVSNPVIRNGRVFFSTLTPNTDPCGYGGTSFLMNMDARSGARTDYGPFDVNGDGKFTDADLITVTIAGVTTKVAASGIASTVGITGTGTVVTSSDATFEMLYSTGTEDDTSGNGDANALAGDKLNAVPGAFGRQSWRQLR
jgi:type IV pilus assembly protein PilY1